jgi:hypothetical protein
MSESQDEPLTVPVADAAVPAELLARVRDDLRPVRPLAGPALRTLVLVPVGLVLIFGMPALWGLRKNFAALGSGAAWGLSAIQALAGLLIVGLALREAVPGRELRASTVAAMLGAGAALFFALTFLSERLAPTVIPAGIGPRFAWECFWMATSWSVPALAVAAWLVARALPNRPALAGTICGLGAGLMADSGVRLFCWVSNPLHVLIAHGGAILFLMIAGAATATAVERIKSRLRERSRRPRL